jgi:hypothetical protein
MHVHVFKLCIHVNFMLSDLYKITNNCFLYKINYYDLISSPAVNKWKKLEYV